MEDKIQRLIEEAKLSPITRGAVLAGAGGMVGAGLDVLFNDGHNIKDFAKPLAAWGLGGAAGAALQGKAEEKEQAKKIKDERRLQTRRLRIAAEKAVQRAQQKAQKEQVEQTKITQPMGQKKGHK